MASNSGQVRDYHAFPDDELPEGWCRSSLGNLSELVSGAGFPIKYQGRTGLRYPFFKVGNLGDVNSGELLTETPDTIDNVIINELHAKIIPTNSIVFAKIGMAIRLNRRRMVGVPCCIDNNMMAAVPNGAALPHYLLRFLETVDFMALTQATTVPSIRKGDFESISIPLPPIVEQKRIVAKVEELFEQVNAAKERLARVSLILKRFRQAVLAAACSGHLTADWREKNPDLESAETLLENIQERRLQRANTHSQRQKIDEIYSYQEEGDSHSLPENWRHWALDKLCESFQYGTSKKSEPSGKVAVLRMGNIQDGEIDWNDLVYTSDDEEIKKYKLNPGDILFNRTNSPELVGKTAIYRGEHPAIFAGYLIKIHYFKELDSSYLNVCLNTTYAKHFCMKVKTDGVSQSNINAQKLGKFEVPFCPLEEQHEIVRRVEALFKLADVVEKRVAAATARAEKLTQAILAKAFRGELVPTEAELARRERRPYETASELLARINSERESKGASKLTPRNRNQQKARRTRPAQ